MTSISNTSQLILKVFSGLQSGVEVALSDGEYTFGCGPDDDLQFVDLLLKSGHARLRIRGGVIAIAGGAGGLSTGSGLQIEAGDEEWREIEPLDLLTIGGITIAIGAPDAKWAELTANMEQRRTPGKDTERSRPSRPNARSRDDCAPGWGRYAAVALGCVFVLASLLWLIVPDLHAGANAGGAQTGSDFQIVRRTLDGFPFGRSISLREEVDGALYVEGYVEALVEQRALKNAIEEAGIQVHLRLRVLQTIRTQIDATIANQGVDVTYDLSPAGAVTFEGVILSEEASGRFLDTIRREVLGLSDIAYNVKTEKTYFAEVRHLAARSGVDDTVLFRLDNKRIEASGVVMTDKIDAWVGFIQAYARRYADRIPLTSYVQLVNEQGQVLAQGRPTVVGASAAIEGSRKAESGAQPEYVLDLEKLKHGVFGARDVFAGLASSPADEGETTASIATAGAQGGPRDSASAGRAQTSPLAASPTGEESLLAGARALLERHRDGDSGHSGDGGARRAPGGSADTVVGGQAGDPAGDLAGDPADGPTDDLADGQASGSAGGFARGSAGGLVRGSGDAAPASGATASGASASGVPGAETPDMTAQRVLEHWNEVAQRTRPPMSSPVLSPASSAASPQTAGGAPAAADRNLRAAFLPLILQPKAGRRQCWDGSALTESDLVTVLFWLDFLSLTTEKSLVSFDEASQYLLLEAALNPERTRQCAQRLAGEQGLPLPSMSFYLDEARRNPAFVRFLVRDFRVPAMEISGVMLRERIRYLQMKNGVKIREGSSPDVSSRLSSVGALGALVRSDKGLVPVIYSDDLSWKAFN
ncbi:EscD/YscD/HrpQ family type III secretion system periplasmic domain-containing protein [Breoghania sp. JC706]|uniref:EscD/YscD/HrpQ family type III secretion system periplasmic domain-containing protein n=1 Tax=Breoghania sp. JC706 TaxID=3117732 RepID=UPI0030089E80